MGKGSLPERKPDWEFEVCLYKDNLLSTFITPFKLLVVALIQV